MKPTSFRSLVAAFAALPLTASALTLPVSEDTSTTTNAKLAKTAGKATTLPVAATRSALVRFEVSALSSVIPSANVTSARLLLYIGSAKTPGDLTLHRVTGDWSEVFVSPLVVPSIDATALQTIAAANVVAKQFIVLDVTSTVKAWLDGTTSDFGFAIQATGLTNVLLGSKEGSGAGYPAELEIDTAVSLPDGSIGTVQLTNGGVTMVKIADGAVGSTQLSSGLTLGGTTTGTFSGPLTGDVTGNVSGTAAGFTGSLAGDVTGPQSATAIASSTVTGKLLTGFTSSTGSLAASDSILGALGKLDGNFALKAPLASPTFSGTVTLPAGTAADAPLRLQTGVNLTTPVFGAVEFDGTNLFLTNNSGTPTRKTIAFTDSAITNAQLASNLTLGGTTTGTFTGPLTGNASTATKLVTSRTINGISFDGTTNITISAAAGTLTGATLASGVTGSSLTSVGTLIGGATGAGFTIDLNASSVSGTLANARTTATSANTASAIVARDASGNFSAGSITATGLSLPTTSDAGTGVINQNGSAIIHSFGNSSFFAGPGAGNFSNTAFNNAGFGANALAAVTTGGGNTAVGSSALSLDTTGVQNSAVGLLALGANTVGIRNTAVGNQALGANTTAGSNVAIGSFALFTQSFSNGGFQWNSENVAVGVSALSANQPISASTGFQNTAIGAQSMVSNTIGSFNTAVGKSSLASNTTASQNTALGHGALFSQSFSNAGAAWISNNTAVGYNALLNNQPGTTNDGISNTAVGSFALQANTTGAFNTALGVSALATNSTGNNNSAVGRFALNANSSGVGNSAFGYIAMLQNISGDNNVALGSAALQQNTVGASNTAVGVQALQQSTGTNNIAIGYQAGSALTAGNLNIDIGHVGAAAEGATIRIGTLQTRAFIAGIRGVTTGVNNAVAVVIDGNGQLGTVSSSRRYKEDIADMGDASARLEALRPVTFRYKKPYDDGEKPVQFGLIAEEVAEVFPELCVRNADGQPETVKYQDLAPMLLNEVQKLTREKAAMQEEIAALKARQQDLDTLKARLERLEQLMPPAK